MAMQKPQPKYYVSQYRNVPSITERLNDNLLVPAGAMATIGCYAVGLKSMVHGQYNLGKRMMLSRIFFQGITVAAMFYDRINSLKDKTTELLVNSSIE